ncbi:VanZ family protein [Actinoplanes sp. NPDC051411]|uniref:VanZ family protein n=1 Tax=Actinoplanes sp. NPDC051411 TaxID=3155522 RepID=UPI003435C607
MLDSGVIWNVVDQWPVLSILALTAVLAWPLGRRLGRGAPGVAFVAVLGAVLAATTTTRQPEFSLGGLHPYLREFLDPVYLLDGFGSTAEKLANIGLFLPLAALATLLWRRPVGVVAASAGLSFLIEAWQAYIGRAGDAVDVVHNTFGAILGTIVALAVVSSRRTGPAH